jgi:hypothetical protein
MKLAPVLNIPGIESGNPEADWKIGLMSLCCSK